MSSGRVPGEIEPRAAMALYLASLAGTQELAEEARANAEKGEA